MNQGLLVSRATQADDKLGVPLHDRQTPISCLPITPALCGLALLDFRERVSDAQVCTSEASSTSSDVSGLGLLSRYYWDKKVQILYSLSSSLVLSIPINKFTSWAAHAAGASDMLAFSAGAIAGTASWYIGFYSGLSIEDRFRSLKDSSLSAIEKIKQSAFGIVEGKNFLNYAVSKAFTFGATTLVLETLWLTCLVKAEMVASKNN